MPLSDYSRAPLTTLLRQKGLQMHPTTALDEGAVELATVVVTGISFDNLKIVRWRRATCTMLTGNDLVRTREIVHLPTWHATIVSRFVGRVCERLRIRLPLNQYPETSEKAEGACLHVSKLD